MDRRSHMRVQVDRRCILTCSAADGTMYQGQVLNLGRGGALVEIAGWAPPALARGTEVEIDVLLDGLAGFPHRSIRGRGRVVRVDDDASPLRVAVQFHTVAFAAARYYGTEQAAVGMVV